MAADARPRRQRESFRNNERKTGFGKKLEYLGGGLGQLKLGQ